MRDYLRDRGLLGTSILWFELDRDGDGGPLPAERWREYCLSSVTTHDLPPTAGYLAGEHVRLRDELGLLTRPVDEELADDRAEQAAWVAELRRVGLLGEKPGVDETVLALYRVPGPHPVAAARPVAGRCGRRDAHPEPAGHHRRIPELAGPAGRPRRASAAARGGVRRPPRGRALPRPAGSGEPPGVTLRRVFTGFTIVTAAICSQRTDVRERSREEAHRRWAPAAVAASTIGLLSAGLASSDPVNPNQLNVIGEPYYKAVKILHGMGMSTTFGGSVGSDLPQAQCMVTSQKMLGSGRMQMNLDCTEEAAQEMAESGSMSSGGAPWRGRREHVEARTGPDRPRIERRRPHIACARTARRLSLGQARRFSSVSVMVRPT